MIGNWLALAGTIIAALTAGIVALVVDARRRKDAHRARLDDTRLTFYTAYLGVIDDEIWQRAQMYREVERERGPSDLYLTAARTDLLMTLTSREASADVVVALRKLSGEAPMRTGETSLSVAEVETRRRTNLEAAKLARAKLLHQMKDELRIPHE